MIDEESLLAFANRFRDRRQLEKDYLLNLMLRAIATDGVSEKLVFKGGTALAYFYGLDRFSEDLDFSYIFSGGEDVGDAIGAINKGFGRVMLDYGASYAVRKEKSGILEKDRSGEVIAVRSEVFIEGPLFAKSGRPSKIKIDISLRRDLIAAKEKAEMFTSKYRDIGSFLIYVMHKDEILAEKLCSLAERARARDLYDLYFLVKHGGARFDKEIFASKVKLRHESFGLKDVIGSIRHIGPTLWKEELSYIVMRLPELEEAKRVSIAALQDAGAG
jgi:predicted nucleotidyltransferase component of viral defense system